MGIYDREYARRPSGPSNIWESMRTWSASTWIAIVLLGAFLANGLSRTPENFLTGSIYGYSVFSVPQAIGHLQLWRILTFQFVHEGIALIFVNLLAVVAFGPMVESYMGRRRFLVFYLLCGAAPVAVFVGLWYAGAIRAFPDPELSELPASLAAAFQPHMAGASGAVFGILIVAAVRVATDAGVELPGFTTIPVNGALMAWLLLAVVAWFTLGASGFPWDSGVDRAHLTVNACHLAGAGLGALFIWGPTLSHRRRRPQVRRRRTPTR